MRIPFKPVALTAGHLSSRRAHTGNGSAVGSSQILMSAPGYIGISEFDGTSFTTTLNATVPGNPSWVEYVAPNKVYAVDETGTDMRLFHLDLGVAGVSKPTLSDAIAKGTGSSGNVHLVFTPDHTRMVSASYGAGTIDIWNVEDDKVKLIKTIESKGELGPHKPNQDQAHPHETVRDPTGRFFLVNDLGTDQILFLDSKADAWDQIGSADAPAGCGPRHGTFFPEGAPATHYIVACELSNDVVVYSVQYGDDADSLSSAHGNASAPFGLTKVQATKSFVGAVPDGAAAAEVALTPDSKTLYVSNRLTGAASDNVARFDVSEDGKISIVDETKCDGVQPRHFSLGDDGSLLIVANQNGENAVSAFSLDKDGSIVKDAVAHIPMKAFGGPDAGPTYIKQI